MWKEVESRKADKARMEEVRREGRKKEMRKLMIKEEKTITRIMEEKKEEEEDLIELRTTDEIVPR